MELNNGNVHSFISYFITIYVKCNKVAPNWSVLWPHAVVAACVSIEDVVVKQSVSHLLNNQNERI